MVDGSDTGHSSVTQTVSLRLEISIGCPTQRTSNRDDAIKFFRDIGVIAAPVLTVAEAVDHPQFKSRGMMETVAVRDHGPIPLPKAPFHMSRTPPRIPPKIALLGEDNREILGQCLGYKGDTVDALLSSGVLGQDPAMADRR